MDFRGKHAFITGAGRRLGRALAEELLGLGANLSAHCHRSELSIKELQAMAEKNHWGRVLPIQADLTDFSAIQRAVNASIQSLGPVDILINSASDFYSTPLLTTQSQEWEQLFNLNLKAPFFLTQQLAATMPQGSNIIFVADVHGTCPIKNYAPYCATKAGLISITKSLAKELAPSIRVNSISPGTVLPNDNATDVEIKKAAERSLLGRVGSPHDFVEGVLFLLRNAYMTGFDLVVDGGRSLT